jgi:hypothetical protein
LACLETVAANSLYRGLSTHHDMNAPRDEPVQIQTWVAGGPRRPASQPVNWRERAPNPSRQPTDTPLFKIKLRDPTRVLVISRRV